MTTPRPSITCVMPTTNRFELFQRSLACYCRQTYPERELVVVTNGGAEYFHRVSAYIEGLGRPDIRPIPLDRSGWNLGQMRNLTLAHARGEVVCQWDDDDMYHPRRLETQLRALVRSGARSCFLTEQLQYFEERNELYWVKWDCWPALPRHQQVAPNTMMCWRSTSARYPESGPLSDRGEDTAFAEQLEAEGPIAMVSRAAYLYVYTYHGGNVFPFEHHWNIVRSWREALSRAQLSGRRRSLERELRLFDWGRPEVLVCGKDGLAFRYRPAIRDRAERALVSRLWRAAWRFAGR